MPNLVAVCLFVSFFAQALSVFTVTFEAEGIVPKYEHREMQLKLDAEHKLKLSKLAEAANTHLQRMSLETLQISDDKPSEIARAAFGEKPNIKEIHARFEALKSVSLRILGIVANAQGDAGRVSKYRDPLRNYVLLYPRFLYSVGWPNHVPDEILSLLLIQWAVQQEYPPNPLTLDERSMTQIFLYPDYLTLGYPKSVSDTISSGFTSNVMARLGTYTYQNAPSYAVALSLIWQTLIYILAETWRDTSLEES